jgi:sterol desaturase/sphingolipid hydroxylase (fatty acid hydroxylase superfamily)
VHALLLGLLDWVRPMTAGELALWSLAENLAIFLGALVGGELLVRLFRDRPVADPPSPVCREELLCVASCVLLNALITLVGGLLWQRGWIAIRTDLDGRDLLDFAVLFGGMDALMYVFHRAAHHPWVYPIAHATHHRYDNPRPLTLFVLNPIETLGFGALWLLLLAVYPAGIGAIAAYLTVNVLCGMVGHLGVEPVPEVWPRHPVLGWLMTSRFHADHHHDGAVNFGFYTLFWDWLFGTLAPPDARGAADETASR